MKAVGVVFSAGCDPRSFTVNCCRLLGVDDLVAVVLQVGRFDAARNAVPAMEEEDRGHLRIGLSNVSVGFIPRQVHGLKHATGIHRASTDVEVSNVLGGRGPRTDRGGEILMFTSPPTADRTESCHAGCDRCGRHLSRPAI